ncbi:cell wall-binding repeat-containing protein [Stomatohabitans albus]|uniref:cell wall-binding repeat-containing protein n=1 Tax=Stomatohabitans albus TaxID=3110766 RepID=UPI00300DA3B9
MEYPPKAALAAFGAVALGLVAHFLFPDPQELPNQPPEGATPSLGAYDQIPADSNQTITNESMASPESARTSPHPTKATPTASAEEEDQSPRCLAPEIEFERVSGKDRFATAISVSKTLYKARSEDHVVLVSAMNYPDAIAALNTSKPGDATPILLTPSEGLTPEIEAELRRIATNDATVTVIGGPTVISDSLIAQVQGFGYTVERIAGPDRVTTSMSLADHYSKNARNRTYIISPADDYAVSLVAGALAVSRNATHVMSPTGSGSNPVYGWLHERNPYELWVIGDGLSTALANRSSHFVHADIAPAIEQQVSYPESTCAPSADLLQPGPGQQTIAERVLTTAFRDATDIVVVDADSPVDGIAAGQMAAQYNAPILPLYRDMHLVDRYVGLIKTLGAKERMIHFVGGKRSISDGVKNHFVEYLSQ